MLFSEGMKSNRSSLILADGVHKRGSVHLSPAKKRRMRNSVTTKVLSTYATLAALEDSQTKMEKKVRRTSADFATLCNMMFSDDKTKDTKALPNSETMASMAAIIFGDEKRASLTSQKKKRASTKRSSLISAKKRQSSLGSILAAASSAEKKSNKRASSNPIDRISKILNANDLEAIKRRSVSAKPASQSRPPSVVPPPKPASKLDPRYPVYDEYKRKSLGSANLLDSVGESGKKKKRSRRRRTTGDAEIYDNETVYDYSSDDDYDDTCDESGNTLSRDFLKGLKQAHMYDSQEGIHAPKRDSVDTAELLRSAGRRVDSSGTVIRKGEGRSKNEKRHSVLSLYSTKASSTCLSAYLNDIENDKKSNDVVDMDVSFDQNG
ncbi:unnamed protein product [Ambrosiozyma monospora]|uniref:Unnamed protein product n=1 Tax=Ambrosiozyma monospora TaxID=43982 RepID=A0ACB5TC76_AMBMO|nr:unnamed protein product [Ambrosiozyma monospora]